MASDLAVNIEVEKANGVDSATGLSKAFHRVTTRLYVSLAPVFFNEPINGIEQQHLNPLLMTFFPETKGVILAYSNVKFLNQNYAVDHDSVSLVGTVKYDTPYVFMWISVDFLVWRPKVGDVIEGYSYMQTPSHIGLLVLDGFNASIKKYSIPSNWEFVANAVDEGNETSEESGNIRSMGHWVDENGVKVEAELKFTVKALHTTGKLVSLEGTLLQPNQEAIKETQPSNSHKKFFDQEYTQDTSLTEIPKPVKDRLPNDLSNDHGKIVAEANSSEDETDD